MPVLEHAATYRFAHDVYPVDGLAYLAHEVATSIAGANAQGIDVRGMRALCPLPEGIEEAGISARDALHLSVVPVIGMRRIFGHDVTDCLADPQTRQAILEVPEIDQEIPLTLVKAEITPDDIRYPTRRVNVSLRFSESDGQRLRDHQQKILEPMAAAAGIEAEELLELTHVPHITILHMRMRVNELKRSQRRAMGEQITEGINTIVSPVSPLPIFLSRLVLPRLTNPQL